MATTKKATKKTTVGLDSPWYIFADTVAQIFANDESVNVDIPKSCKSDDGTFEFVISSEDAVKIAAIKKLIGETRQYGNVTVNIIYNVEDAPMTVSDVVTAFGDTGYFDKVVSLAMPVGEMDYVVMKKDVLQVYGDNTRDYYGNINTVVAQAIESIIQDDVKVANIAICTKADKDPE